MLRMRRWSPVEHVHWPSPAGEREKSGWRHAFMLLPPKPAPPLTNPLARQKLRSTAGRRLPRQLLFSPLLPPSLHYLQRFLAGSPGRVRPLALAWSSHCTLAQWGDLHYAHPLPRDNCGERPSQLPLAPVRCGKACPQQSTVPWSQEELAQAELPRPHPLVDGGWGGAA